MSKVLDFLHTLFIQELTYSTINTTRSALASYLMDVKLTGTDYTMSNHPLLICCTKGVFNSRKPTPKHSETWDVNQVLAYMKKLLPLDELTFKDLSFKLVMLLALTFGQQCQTLTGLNIKAMKKTPDYYLFHLMEHMKQNRPGNVFLVVSVRTFHQEELCVYRTLQCYLDWTTFLRDSTTLNCLFHM